MNNGILDGTGFVGGWGTMAFGGLMMIFWFALIIGLFVLVVRWITGTPAHTTGPDPAGDALETLKQRFARGEIDAPEFQDRSRQLKEPE